MIIERFRNPFTWARHGQLVESDPGHFEVWKGRGYLKANAPSRPKSFRYRDSSVLMDFVMLMTKPGAVDFKHGFRLLFEGQRGNDNGGDREVEIGVSFVGPIIHVKTNEHHVALYYHMHSGTTGKTEFTEVKSVPITGNPNLRIQVIANYFQFDVLVVNKDTREILIKDTHHPDWKTNGFGGVIYDMHADIVATAGPTSNPIQPCVMIVDRFELTPWPMSTLMLLALRFRLWLEDLPFKLFGYPS